MKTFIKVIFCFTGLLWLIMMLPGCDNEPLDGGPFWGTINAIKNGEPWSGKIKGLEQNDKLGFLVNKHSKEGFLRESLSVRKIPKTVGIYNIPKTDTTNIYNHVTSFHATLQDDGDAIQGVYYVDPNSINFVELKSIQGDFFEGSFEVVFLIDTESKNRYPFLPDSIRFTNGRFKTRILQKL